MSSLSGGEAAHMSRGLTGRTVKVYWRRLDSSPNASAETG